MLDQERITYRGNRVMVQELERTKTPFALGAGFRVFLFFSPRRDLWLFCLAGVIPAENGNEGRVGTVANEQK